MTTNAELLTVNQNFARQMRLSRVTGSLQTGNKVAHFDSSGQGNLRAVIKFLWLKWLISFQGNKIIAYARVDIDEDPWESVLCA